MNKFLFYGFQNRGETNISKEIVSKLNTYNSLVLDCHDVDAFQATIDNLLVLAPNYEYIIGMGQYSGRDQEQIRVEGLTKNSFRNGTTREEGIDLYELYRPDLDSDVSKKLKHTQAMGNSWCNLSAYLASESISKNRLKTKLVFLHIPKSFQINEGVDLINALVKSLETINS